MFTEDQEILIGEIAFDLRVDQQIDEWKENHAFSRSKEANSKVQRKIDSIFKDLKK